MVEKIFFAILFIIGSGGVVAAATLVFCAAGPIIGLITGVLLAALVICAAIMTFD